ncbi:hypothetical protein BpHYR1_026549 [Brachionus plicatilis]|uniref:Uncharacterized protein n=1 Tax=Brachionus plicatilis TaxID=10195 RepID=A0A3M7SCH8_BRAPC|nr:hypothetical protein BpHYR1_026549 [Brachionus plicatilis]
MLDNKKELSSIPTFHSDVEYLSQEEDKKSSKSDFVSVCHSRNLCCNYFDYLTRGENDKRTPGGLCCRVS